LLGGERLRRSRQAASRASQEAAEAVAARRGQVAPAFGSPVLGAAAAGAGAGQADIARLGRGAAPALDRGAVPQSVGGHAGAGGRHASGQRAVRQEEAAAAVAADSRLGLMSYLRAVLIGSAQILALLPGISRDGMVTVTGMARGLSREDAVR